MYYSVNKWKKAYKPSNANKNEGFSVDLCEINLRDPKSSGKDFATRRSFACHKRKSGRVLALKSAMK